MPKLAPVPCWKKKEHWVVSTFALAKDEEPLDPEYERIPEKKQEIPDQHYLTGKTHSQPVGNRRPS